MANIYSSGNPKDEIRQQIAPGSSDSTLADGLRAGSGIFVMTAAQFAAIPVKDFRAIYIVDGTILTNQGPQLLSITGTPAELSNSSVFHQRGNSGPVISEEMAAEGIRFRPSDRGHGSRINGRNRLHELLKVQEFGYDENTGEYITSPGIIFFNTCRQTISDLQVIPTDPKGGEDIDDRFVSDHTYDALRYGIMSRPKAHTFYEEFQNTFSSHRPADSVFGY